MMRITHGKAFLIPEVDICMLCVNGKALSLLGNPHSLTSTGPCTRGVGMMHVASDSDSASSLQPCRMQELTSDEN